LRAVLDVNVIVSALLSRDGTPATLIRSWVQGAFDLVVFPALLGELQRVLAYPKVRDRILPDEARSLIDWLERSATVVGDPEGRPHVTSADPGDDYLIALASAARAVLVSGDGHLLGIKADVPIMSPAAFREVLDRL
jgi:putative PIN family toxin of toxin-antitoxin system